MREIPPAGAQERDRDHAIISLIRGRSNASGVVTLSAGATTTTVARPNCNNLSSVTLTPATANAAAALATTFVPQATITGTGFVVQHANNAQTDRTFYFLVIGG